MSHLKWISMGGVAVVAVAAVGSQLWSADAGVNESASVKSPASRPATASPAPSAAVATTSPERCRFEVGQRMAYTLSAEDEARFEPAAFGLAPTGAGAATPGDATAVMRNEAKGALELEVLESSEERAVLLGRFVGLESSLVQRDDRLAAPFLVRVEESCALDGFAYAEDTPLPYARIQQALLYDLSWALPEGSESSFEGADTMGQYRATLTALAAKASITKRFTGFESWRSGMGQPEAIDRGQLVVSRRASPWFDRASLRVSLSGRGTSFERSLDAAQREPAAGALEAASHTQADYLWADLLSQDLPLDEPRARTNAERDALAAAGRRDFDAVLDDYVDRVQSGAGIQDTWPPLKTYLEAKPEYAQELIERMKRGEIPGEATMGVYIALGNAETGEAREALEGVMRDEAAPVFERNRAIFSLIDRADVGIEVAQYLDDRARTIGKGEVRSEKILARQAMLALGAMAGRKSGDDEIRDRASRAVAQTLRTTSAALEKRPVYGALANIGDPALLELVEEVIDEPDYKVRKAAAIVTRRMPPKESADFTARWLARETDWRVKVHLWNTVELQTFDAREMTSDAVLRYALEDLKARPGVLTRKSLIRLLARAKDDKPDTAFAREVEAVFLELIPFELRRDSGVYTMLAEEIDDPMALRAAVSQATRPDSAGTIDLPSQPYQPQTPQRHGADPTYGEKQ